MAEITRLRVTRRGLQIVLGLLWLVDAGLQFQPFMFGTGFAREVIAPAAAGQPRVVAGPVNWAAGLLTAHPAPWNAAFASMQLILGLGMLVPRTAKLALAASLPWAFGVWYFGESLSGLAGGNASLVTGAPGSVLLYGVLALAAWPRRAGSDVPPARWLPLAWAALWVGGALFQALPRNDTGSDLADAIRDGAQGAPHGLARLDARVATLIAAHGTAVVVALVVVEALIGLAALVRRTTAVAAVAGGLLTLAFWAIGQDFGQLYSGHATDPSTAPLVLLMAVVLLACFGAAVRTQHDSSAFQWSRRRMVLR